MTPPPAGTAPNLTLHHMPGACSRVALFALEEAGLPYVDIGVSLMTGQQRSPNFLALNPKGKVPVLASDDRTLTELPVILMHLASLPQGADLLPRSEDDAPVRLEALSDLLWLSGASHPLANRIFRPAGISEADAAGVKSRAIAALRDHAAIIAVRLERGGGWWWDGRFTMVDALCAWVFGVAAAAGFPLDAFPVVADHRTAVEGRPAFARTLARERAAVARDGLAVPPGFLA